MRQVKWLLFCSALWMGCGTRTAPKPTPPQTGSPSTDESRQVLARVDSSVITKGEFLKAYQQHGVGQTPRDFLNGMIRERMFLLEARARKLQHAEFVQQTERKALVRVLLQRDFERWFTPNDIDILLVRKYYNSHLRKYYRPQMAKAVHVLVREPISSEELKVRKLTQGELTQTEKQVFVLARQNMLALARQLRDLMIKANPATPKAFMAIASRFEKQHNTPDPRLSSWFQELQRVMRKHEDSPGPVLRKALLQERKKLSHIPLCQYCNALSQIVGRAIAQWRQGYKAKVPKKARKQLLQQTRQTVNYPRRRVIAQHLPYFPRVPTPGWPVMVEPFTRATFALQDGEYTKKLVKSKFGYHLIFRVDTKKSKHISLLRAAPEIRRKLFQSMRPRKYKQWLQLIYKKYKPVGYLNRLRANRRE